RTTARDHESVPRDQRAGAHSRRRDARPRADSPRGTTFDPARAGASRRGRVMRVLAYSLDEALVSLWRGRRSGILSMGSIAVACFVLGGFLVVTSTLERLAAEWASAADYPVTVPIKSPLRSAEPSS